MGKIEKLEADVMACTARKLSSFAAAAITEYKSGNAKPLRSIVRRRNVGNVMNNFHRREQLLPIRILNCRK